MSAGGSGCKFCYLSLGECAILNGWPGGWVFDIKMDIAVSCFTVPCCYVMLLEAAPNTKKV